MDERARALDAAHRSASAFFDTLDDRPVWPTATLDDMIEAFGGPLAETGTDAEEVVSDLATRAAPGLVGIPGGRFFGFVIGGTLPAALASDWLVSAWDQNSGSSAMTTATVALERVAGRWMCELMGLPQGSAVGFVTGAQMSNFVCLSTAQHEVLRQEGWDLAERGLRGAPPVRLIVGADRHGSVDRAARFCGIGRSEIVVVDSDDEGRMVPAALDAALRTAPGIPTIVCLQAGEVHTGAFDPFTEVVPLAKEHGSWVHIDGAFGLWAAASRDSARLTAGIEGADSWTTDAHKTLNVPYDCGMAIVRDPAHAVAAFHATGDYLVFSEFDPWDVGPELSRRARGVPAWAALRSLGRTGVAELVDRMCANARRLADGLRRIHGLVVINEVEYTQVLFRLEDDEATRELGRAILVDGTAALTGAQWRGRPALRCSMSSWVTTDEDVDVTVAAIERLIPTVASAR